MPSVIAIRAATSRDYDALLPLFLELRRFSRDRHPPRPDDFAVVLASGRDYLREILARGAGARTLLAVDQSETIAGYLVATLREPNPLTSAGAVRTGSIDELFVDDRYRGTGAGGALVDAAIRWFRERGAERAEVGAYSWNADAIAFYERHGFVPFTVTLTRPLA
jgi:GNAT superfamily N-acetyltransferase